MSANETKVSPEQMQQTLLLWLDLTLEMFKLWDSDQDHKVGKMLVALCMRNRGYREDIDRIIDTLEDTPWPNSGGTSSIPKN